MSYWVYKCNSRGANGPAWGDWLTVFEHSGPVGWGQTAIIPALARLRRGDTLLAYQTNRNELVGTVRVVGFSNAGGTKRVVVQAIEKIGAKVRPLKKADPKIDRIPALQGGIIATLYEISDRDAVHLIQVAKRKSKRGSQPSATEESVIDTLEAARLEGQGFQTDPEFRRAVERLAVRRAKRHYEKLGYSVIERGKPFDLECTKSRGHLYVEVKGTQTTGLQLILTPNEVDFALAKPMQLFMVHSVRVSKVKRRVAVSGGIDRIISPWRPRRTSLKILAYSVFVGKGG